MQKRAGLLTAFIFFFVLALLIFFLRNQLAPISFTVFETVTYPIQKTIYSSFGGAFVKAGGINHAQEINRELAKKIVDQAELVKEAKALRDQYNLEELPSEKLTPAQVIGMKSFIPGVSLPEEIILDKGSKQGVMVGQTVITTNNVVGSIATVSDRRSLVSLISQKSQSLTAKTVETQAIGILRGKGTGTMALENVILSETLKKGDIVVTKGEMTVDGKGYPPDLVIGKIHSVDKKPSDLFQSAEVESLVDFTSLDTVFILAN